MPGAADELLQQARQKAVALLDRLRSEQAEVDDRQAPDWHVAMRRAIGAAERAVAAIEAAIKVAPAPEDGEDLGN